jgi:Leucine-rich repeat (LRR) protein
VPSLGGIGLEACPKSLPLRADVLLSNTLFEELDDSISVDFLRQQTGKEDLSQVDFLEMQVDAVSGSQRVECLGENLPNLTQLRLNQSALCTIRDLGTSYMQLRVLWLCRSALQDLGGITAMPQLEELFISFNDVRDLSPLYTHDAIQILDVEGNLIDDFEEIEGLQTLITLRELTLNSNPLCKSDGFSRERVLEVLPRLEVLDDVSRGSDMSDGVKVLEFDDLDADLAADAAFLAGLGEDLADHTTSGSDKEAVDREPNESDEVPEPEAAAENTEASEAVAELRKAQAQLRAETVSGGESPVKSKSPNGEPSEQELVVENLKRSRRPVPNIRSLQAMTARPDMLEKRPCTGFFPDRRGLRTAWSCSGSSTTYRPSTASGSSSSAITASSAAVSAEDMDPNASDLTMGVDGSSLAGGALSAVRRRRKVAKERGEDEHNIRDMLRRFESFAQESCLSPAELELRRRKSEMKRPGTSDVRVSAPRLLTASGRPAAFPNSLPGAPGESWVKSSVTKANRRPSSRPSRDFADFDFFAPTFSTAAGEALIID